MDNDLFDVLKAIEMIPLDSDGFDIEHRQEFDLVLLDLAPFGHEEELLFGVVMEVGEGVHLQGGFV